MCNVIHFTLVQLYNAFYVYNIHDKLSGAEKILHALGYHPRQPSLTDSFASSPTQELVYKEEVNRDRVASLATDLVLLQSDLEHLRERIKACHSHGRGKWLVEVLKAWENNVRDISVRSAGSVGGSRSDGRSGGGSAGGRVHCDDSSRVKYVRSLQCADDETEDSGYTSEGVSLHWKNSEEFKQMDSHTEKCGLSDAWSPNGVVVEKSASYEHDPSNPQQRLSHSPAHGSKGFYQRDQRSSRAEKSLSNSTSADEDSFLSKAQLVPRPNINELPEPAFGMSDDVYSPVDDHCQESLGHIVDSRSNYREDSLIGNEYYASLPPDESIAPSFTLTRFNRLGSEDELIHPVPEVGRNSFWQLEQSNLRDRQTPKNNSSELSTIVDTYVVVEHQDLDLMPATSSNSVPASAKKTAAGEKILYDDKSESNSKLKPNGIGELCNNSRKNTTAIMTRQGSLLSERSGEVDGFIVVDVEEGEFKDEGHKILTKPIPRQPAEPTNSLPDFWTCNYCTFINTVDVDKCGICDVKVKRT